MTTTEKAADEKGVLVVLVHPATWPEDVKVPAKTKLTVPRAVADNWEKSGVAIKI